MEPISKNVLSYLYYVIRHEQIFNRLVVVKGSESNLSDLVFSPYHWGEQEAMFKVSEAFFQACTRLQRYLNSKNSSNIIILISHRSTKLFIIEGESLQKDMPIDQNEEQSWAVFLKH